jgi:hypothetical protein
MSSTSSSLFNQTYEMNNRRNSGKPKLYRSKSLSNLSCYVLHEIAGLNNNLDVCFQKRPSINWTSNTGVPLAVGGAGGFNGHVRRRKSEMTPALKENLRFRLLKMKFKNSSSELSLKESENEGSNSDIENSVKKLFSAHM